MIHPGEIGELCSRAGKFRKELSGARSRVTRGAWEWYPYDSLANLAHLDQLLTGANRDLLRLSGGQRVLDIGCADGDLAFFLESLGIAVTALDLERSNHNGMQGVRALKEELRSSIAIEEVDLDAQFKLGDRRFGLVFLLGALYHLKNPFYVLETLAKHADYCVLSTRIMQVLPGSDSDLSGSPIAYLLHEAELNADNSNFWIFTGTALRRMVERCRWRVVDYLTIGSKQSDPVSERDQRAFCLLRSTYGLADIDLGRGWHQPEQSGWRWTEREFDAAIAPARSGEIKLILKLFVPDAIVKHLGYLTLTASAGSQQLPPATYERAGDYVYERAIEVASADPVSLRFRLSGALPANAADGRELGVIVSELFAE